LCLPLTALYFQFAVFLKNILHKSLDKLLGFVINSNQLVKELNGFEIDPDYIMISLDVTSLFINVPIDLALESISRKWELISHNTLIPLQEFKDAVKFILIQFFLRLTTFVINKFMAHL